MQLTMTPREERRMQPSLADQVWVAASDDGGYDGTGATPLEAVTDLCEHLERALQEVSDDRP